MIKLDVHNVIDSNIALFVGLNDNTAYKDPINLSLLHRPYFYFGFLPITEAQNNNIQGIKVCWTAAAAAANANATDDGIAVVRAKIALGTSGVTTNSPPRPCKGYEPRL